MNEPLSDNIGDLTPSPPLEIAAKANEMKKSGIDIVDLSAGQPDFPTPPYICEAARQAMERGETGYTATAGIAPLRRAIARKLEVDNGLHYAPEQVIVTVGAKQAIFAAIFCLFGKGDEILVPNPYWVSYPPIITFAGATVRYVKASRESDFRVTPSDLEAVVSDRTRGLILNSPNNPSGTRYSREGLRAIWSFCRERSIWVISDEIYEKIIYDNGPFVSIAGICDDAARKVVVVNGFSKAYSMTGWRIGYAAGPLDLIRAMGSLQSHITSNTSSISQWAALAALERVDESKAFHEEIMDKFSRRRDFILDRMENDLGLPFVYPHGAFYLFFETSTLYGRSVGGYEIKDSVSLCRYLLEKWKVALVPGVSFGRDDYVRMSYAASLGDIEKGLDRLKRGLAPLMGR